MLFKITLTCALCFAFALVISMPYRDRYADEMPNLIKRLLMVTLGATLASLFVHMLDVIWCFS